MNLWTSIDAVTATGGKSTTDWTATGISIDTRSIETGELFVALKDQRDGHDFVAQALQKGASAALVSHVPDNVQADAPLLIVDDVLAALENMARFARKRTDAKVIGVTGSVGKTSTKEMLRTALSNQGNIHAAERSFNNHWGVPLTLARMPADTDFAIIEIGMNHPEEIRPLAKLADLDVAIVTTVAAVHMEAFNGVEEIAHAKAEIFDGLKPTGTAIINNDIDTVEILKSAAKQMNLVTFGRTSGCDYHLAKVTNAGSVTTVLAEIYNKDALFKFQAVGDHFAMNALAVLAGVVGADGDLDKAMLAIGDWTAPAGRGARHLIDLGNDKQIELIDESYNANPASMEAALNVLSASVPSTSKGRKIAILGDMLELGPDELSLHAVLADIGAMENIDQCHNSGPMMRSMHAALPAEIRGAWYQSAQELADDVHNLLDAGDVVMVKGSNGSKVSLIVDAIQKMEKG